MHSDLANQIKLGFYIGLGIVLALMLWSFFQLTIYRAVKRNG